MSYPYEHYVDEAGRQRARRRAGEEVCDFCLAPLEAGAIWTYPTAPMPIKGPPTGPFERHVIDGSDDDFAICPECHKLIAASKIGPLVERIVRLQPIHEPPDGIRRYPPTPIARRVARENVLRFMDARKGSPYLGGAA